MLLLLFAACAPPAATPATGLAVSHDAAAVAAGDFWAAPWPWDGRRRADGTAELAGFPNPDGIPFVADLVGLGHATLRGAGTTSGIFFRLEGPGLDPERLPSLQGSLAGEAGAYLVDLDPSSPERGRRIPISSRFQEDAGPFGGEQLLTLLPQQGIPLRAGTTYGAVLTTALTDTEGTPLRPWAGLSTLVTGGCPEGLSAEGCGLLQGAARSLVELGQDPSKVAGFASFQTQDPTEDLRRWTTAARQDHAPARPADMALVEQFPDYCVYQGSTEMPVFQAGTPPYLDEGGEILEALDGAPVLDHWERARVVLTLPRRPAPAGGFPVAVFIRTGGGGDRPLVDRGPRDAKGTVLEPGSGLARELAQVGFAGVSVDGPHGGLRNVSGMDEQFLMFNVGNPAALRDNVRQSALELALLPGMLEQWTVSASDCPGLGSSAGFDLSTLTLIGHSMGATIAPLSLGLAPEYRATVLSGAGGSYIENIVFKLSPLQVRPVAEAMLGYGERELHEHDPVLSLLQWVGESADPPPWAAGVQAQGVQVLMIQGIVDTYILPPIANTTSLALGLDQAGTVLDADHPALADYVPLKQLLPLVDGELLALPAGGNRELDGQPLTRLVIQHLEDGVEDGHEVLFQEAAPKAQLQAFVSGLAEGAPVVPDP